MRSVVILSTLVAVASGVWAMIAAFRMGAWLQNHGVHVSWFWYRLKMPWYVHRYRKMTTESDGKPGPLFVQFVVAANLALVLAVVAIVAGSVARR